MRYLNLTPGLGSPAQDWWNRAIGLLHKMYVYLETQLTTEPATAACAFDVLIAASMSLRSRSVFVRMCGMKFSKVNLSFHIFRFWGNLCDTVCGGGGRTIFCLSIPIKIDCIFISMLSNETPKYVRNSQRNQNDDVLCVDLSYARRLPVQGQRL